VVDDPSRGIPVEVTLVEELGADAFLYGETDAPHGAEIGSGTPVVVRVEARRNFRRGSAINFTADPNKLHVFDTETGGRIGTRGRAAR